MSSFLLIFFALIAETLSGIRRNNHVNCFKILLPRPLVVLKSQITTDGQRSDSVQKVHFFN